MITYEICDQCAQAITNDDYSGMDPDTDYPRVQAFVERVGNVCHVGGSEQPGYWECEACWQVTIGDGQLFEAVKG
ncbi:hypothetical protein SEA_SUPERCHUNK_96 [Mycobacterium phage Superchunk]|nr:hypothetical protein SEA_SUPERCHUNK_96 [Mycobacterium phage Superchunk]